MSLTIYGILHPDEIFQALEMGHKIAYGSAVIPPEFQNENINDPYYAASRSWSFPLVFGVIMKTMSFFNLDYFTIILPTIRILLAINSTLLIISSRKLAWQITKSRNVELFTTIFVATWYRLIEYTVRSFNNTFFLPILFYGTYRILLSFERGKISKYDHLIVIFGLGIATYNRLDLLLIIFVFFVISFSFQYFKFYLEYALGGIMGWGIGMTIDYHYFGEFKFPPYNWVQFNLIEKKSDIFGLTEWYYYLTNLIYQDGLLPFVILNFVVLIITLFVLRRDKNGFYKENKQLIDSYFRVLFVVSFIWLIYTSFWRNFTIDRIANLTWWEPQSHKEVRFIMGGLVLLLIHISIAMDIGIKLLNKFLQWFVFSFRKVKFDKFLSSEIKYWNKLAVTSLMIILIVGQSWSYANDRQSIEQFADVNQGLTYVGQQDDVTGVIVGIPWFQSGAYTYSHLNSDIPMQFVNFVEADLERLRTSMIFAEYYIRDPVYNYFIAPDYQFRAFPGLVELLTQYDFDLVKLIDGKVDVWKQT
jgi:hypothetical protein